MKLSTRLRSLDDRVLGQPPTRQPAARTHRQLWTVVLVLLVVAALSAGFGAPYLPGTLFSVAVGCAVAAVVIARRSKRP
jgi:hypothetical protein